MMISSKLKNREFLISFAMFLAVFLISFLLLNELNPNTLIVSIYQSRDIHRALGLLNGNFVWYGPEFFGGGQTPGSFYYWLLAVPLALTHTWHSLLPFCNLLAAFSLALLYFYLQKKRSHFVAIWSLLFLLSFSVFTENLKSFWNPSYLPVFMILTIWLLQDLPVLGFFVLALSAQVHFSMLIFLLPALFNLKNKKTIGLSLLSFIVPFLPYIIWRLTSGASGPVQDFSEGVLAAVFPFRKWFHHASFDLHFFDNITELFKENIFLVPGLLLFLIKPQNPFKNNKFLSYSFLFSSISLIWLFFNPMFFRYTLIFFLLTAVAMAVQLERVYQNSKYLFKVWTAVSVSLVIFSLTRNSNSPESVYDQNGYFSHQSFAAFQDLAAHIIKKTGWSYDEFRKKTYVIGVSRETDLSLVYEDEFRNTSTTVKESSYAGVLAVRNDVTEAVPEIFKNFTCETEQTAFFKLCFYNSTEAVELNNIGYSYKFNQPKVALQPMLITIQETASDEAAALSYLFFKIKNNSVEIRAFGDPLGVEDNANNPALASNLKNVELSVECGSLNTTYKVADHIGFEKFRKSFLAPFVYTVKTECTEPIRKMQIEGNIVSLVTSEGFFSDRTFKYPVLQNAAERATQ